MGQAKLFTCDYCGKEGKASILPFGWIAGVRYPVCVSRFYKMTWGVTLNLVPLEVQETLERETVQHQSSPIAAQYPYEDFQCCSAEFLANYLRRIELVNAEVFAEVSTPLSKQITTGLLDALDERDKRKALNADPTATATEIPSSVADATGTSTT